MLAFEGMMNAQRNRGMYLRVARGSPKFANPARYRRLNSLLGVVEGTIQNYEHGRNEPNITRLYDAKRGRQPRVEYICRASLPIRRQARRSSRRNARQSLQK